ncbi:MAG: sialate O-acetylesterase [Victivallaceae bacterium]|nr:sialate O-acetylesterase [Victivallaceae bacterium]
MIKANSGTKRKVKFSSSRLSWFSTAVIQAFIMWIAMFSSPVYGEVHLSDLFSDNMVLQQETAILIWGTAEPREAITVNLDSQKVKCITDKSGNWSAKLSPIMAGGPFELTVSGEKNVIRISNVLIGEVWVCSGQSNMDFRVAGMLNAKKFIVDANYSEIRLFTVAKYKWKKGEKVPKHISGRWAICNPNVVSEFSAVGYCFGKELHKNLNVPIGLINCSYGGTPAEAWIDWKVLKADTEFNGILENWKKWEEKAKKSMNRKTPSPLYIPSEYPGLPGRCYDSMIRPLIPYSIRGVIWYQGESNGRYGYGYRKLFSTLISSWRLAWNQGDFPFLFVQLPNYGKAQSEPVEEKVRSWPLVREAQLMALSLPKTGMAVTIDLGGDGRLHPRDKGPVGNRLALIALGVAYGKKIIYSGLLYERMVIEANKVRLYFSHVNGGLMPKGNRNLKGFAIAGEDKKFLWAQSRIEGKTIVVWNKNIKNPVAVRYGWANNPLVNLYNKAGLPASPFRTDKWKTINK